jgi:hypothetical protein
MRRFLLLVFAGALACDPVCADTLTDRGLLPATSEIGDWTALLDGVASRAWVCDSI